MYQAEVERCAVLIRSVFTAYGEPATMQISHPNSRQNDSTAVEHIATAALKHPQKGKALLQGVVDAILMQPTPDGYAVRVTLKNTNPAALVEDSGVGDYQSGCGGRI